VSKSLSMRHCLRKLVGCALLAAALQAHARTESPLRISEYQKQDWQVEDGLPQSNVRMIIQTADGNLLVATSGGLVSFDGMHFVPVKVDERDAMANEAVNALLVSRNGDLWIGTDGRGIVVQRHEGGTIALSEKEGFPRDRIRNFHEASDGTMWAATQNGVERIRNGHIELLKESGMISGDITTPFAEDGHGGMFFVTARGMFHWRAGVVRPYPLQHTEMGPPVAIYRDPLGRLWVGRFQGLVRLDPEGDGWRETAYSSVHGPVTILLGTNDGELWVGTRHHGVCHLAANGKVTHWTTTEGLPNDAIRSMFIDDEQNLWIGMLNGGLNRWRRAPIIPYGKPEGLPAEYAANVLTMRNGDMWMGTWGKGLYRMHNGRLSNMPLPGMPEIMPIRALAEDAGGNLWIGTWFDGLFRYDGKRFQHYLLGNESPGNAISAVAHDAQGAMWVGTYTGLLKFDHGTPGPGRGQVFLHGLLITCLSRQSDGSLLAGTSTGLYRIRDNTVSQIGGLSHAHVLLIAGDREGNTWIGTKAGGIDLLTGDRVRHVQLLDSPDAYPVYSLIDDGRGFVWMGTTRGVLRLPAWQLNALAHGQRPNVDSLLLGKSDGMRSSECGGPSQPSAAMATDGSLWFATARGFVRTSALAPYVQYPPPLARVLSMTIDGREVAATPELDLQPGLNDVKFNFSAKRLANPWQLEFRYKLEGYDHDWNLTKGRAALYKHLPPGHYRFVVQARDTGMAWSAPMATLNLRQRPYFYQTIWFGALLALAVCASAYFLFRWRVMRIKGRLGVILEERNRISQEWHDTLMAGFAAINWQLETTARLFREDGGTPGSALDACELARSMVTHAQAEARRVIWDLRGDDAPTEWLTKALELVVAKVPPACGIQMQFDVQGREVPLAPGCVHQLARICQEAITNVLRHAKASQIRISLHYQHAALTMTIADNGMGFQPALAAGSSRGHFGIPVMEERARKVGGTLRIDSDAGSGTLVVVHLPFHSAALAAEVQA